MHARFLWKLIEHGFYPDVRSPHERRHADTADYVTSPTMAGGLFAGNRQFFLYDLGGYDEKFMYWGTENLEISFRTWMCGGRLECTHCSIVYHIFRKGGVGYESPVDAVTKNKMRLITGWMDQYGDLAWRVIGQPMVDFGSVDEIKQFREKKQCKSFEWFLDNVFPKSEVLHLPDDVPYLGPVKNIGVNRCLAHYGQPGGTVYLGGCHGGSEENWMYFRISQHWMPVTNDESCFGGGDSNHPNRTEWCDFHHARWEYNATTQQLRLRDNNQCLAANGTELTFAECYADNVFQKWAVTRYNPPETFTLPPRLTTTLRTERHRIRRPPRLNSTSH